MPRRKAPLEVAQVTGRTKQNPERYKGRPISPTETIGGPPDFFNDLQKQIWEEFRANWTHVREDSRAALTILVMFYAQAIEKPAGFKFNAAYVNAVMAAISRFGGTPTDINKLTAAQLMAARRGGDEDEPKGDEDGEIQPTHPEPQGKERFFS